jgi:hypothetical protein
MLVGFCLSLSGFEHKPHTFSLDLKEDCRRAAHGSNLLVECGSCRTVPGNCANAARVF